MSMPSCTGGAAHFGDKPMGVGECGPIKLETFLYCNELPGLSLLDIKAKYMNPAAANQIHPAPGEPAALVASARAISTNSLGIMMIVMVF